MFVYLKKSLYRKVLVFVMIGGISVFIFPRFLYAAKAPLEKEFEAEEGVEVGPMGPGLISPSHQRPVQLPGTPTRAPSDLLETAQSGMAIESSEVGAGGEAVAPVLIAPAPKPVPVVGAPVKQPEPVGGGGGGLGIGEEIFVEPPDTSIGE